MRSANLIHMNYDALQWDSDFFGFKVAKLTSSQLTLETLEAHLAEMRRNGIKLVYWPSSHKLDNNVISKLSGTLADIKTTYFVDLAALSKPIPTNNIAITPYSTSISIDEMETLAIESGKYSRFFNDPMLDSEKAKELFRIWIRNAINKTHADEALIIRDKQHALGMITVVKKDNQGQIGLLAVSPQHTGKSYGEALVKQALSWFITQQISEARVVTQGNNIPACRLYEKCHFNLEKVEYFYHFWL